MTIDVVRPLTDVMLRFDVVSREFRQGRSEPVRALDHVTFDVHRGEIVAVIGPSGAGKTTLAMIALGLDRPTAGSVSWHGSDVQRLRGASRRRAQRDNRLITQDPFGALHPGMTVTSIVTEPLRGSSVARHLWPEVADAALDRVGLDPEVYRARFPHQLSGGQRQRVCIARATVGDPQLVVADEPTSMLDVSVRAAIAFLLRKICTEQSVGMLLITHDLGVARHVADRVVVLQRGAVVEAGPTDAIFDAPAAPMTQALLAGAS